MKLTQQQLADKFKVTKARISAIQTGKTYANAGGNIRQPQKKGWYRRIPEEIRAAIRADYATGNYSTRELARKYGCDCSTIRRILNEEG